MEKQPNFSIITQVLNGATYLEECINSVLNQDYLNIEHIFVDGGSTDGTVEILTKYQGEYPNRIRFISEPDKGAGEAWNKGLVMAKGDVFGWVGSDDTYEPDAIQTVARFFIENPSACFAFGGCNYVNASGEIISVGKTKEFNLEEIIKVGCYVPTPSSFYRREVRDRIGYYDILGNDLDFLIRAGKEFKIYRIEKVLSNFRVHEMSASTGLNKKIRRMWLREDCQISRKYGGGILSGYCKRYYQYLLIESLRPILGFSFPIIKRTLKTLHFNAGECQLRE